MPAVHHPVVSSLWAALCAAQHYDPGLLRSESSLPAWVWFLHLGGWQMGSLGPGCQGGPGEFLISSAPSSLSVCASLGEKWLSSGQ